MVAKKVFHTPVLVNEVLEVLEPCIKDGTIVDGTVGGGGHTEAIACRIKESGARGPIVGLDVDPAAIKFAAERLKGFGCRVVDFDKRRPTVEGEQEVDKQLNREEMIFLVRTSYVNMAEMVRWLGVGPVTAVLMDLGVSSFQLEGARGFSFDHDGMLDMRFDSDGSYPTAWEVLRRASEQDLKGWLRRYGEERFSGRIARKIYRHKGRIRTSRELADLVRSVVPTRYVRKSLARVFQALRIVVNRELENVEAGLEAALRLLSPGGRLAVICYQSGEDRCFKDVYRRWKKAGEEGEGRRNIRLLSPKPIRPGAEEVKINPRARSARLRVVEVTV